MVVSDHADGDLTDGAGRLFVFDLSGENFSDCNEFAVLFVSMGQDGIAVDHCHRVCDGGH